MGRVKVLMFGWEFPPYHNGGLGVACEGLTKALSKQEVDVIFVLPKKNKYSVDYLKFIYAEETTPIHKKYFVNSILREYSTENSYGAEIFKGENSFLYANSLIDEVERFALIGGQIAGEEEFDVIHAHDWLTYRAGVAAKRVSGKKLVIHVHATGMDQCGGQNPDPVVFEIEKGAMEAADQIIAVSNLTKKRIIDHYGISGDKINVVHNAAEFSDYIEKEMHELEKYKKIVLYLGRISIQKGPDYFVSMAKKVIEHCPDTVFIVVGSGDMNNQMIRQVAKLGIADKFIFTGWIRDRHEIQQMFKMAYIYIMPSVSEPFGLVALESMHLGTPVLMSHQSGASEVAVNALKTNFWDIDEMTDKVVSVLKHPALGRTLSQNGKAEVEKITWDEPASKVKNIYNKMIEVTC